MNNSIITIDTKALVLAKDKAGEIILTQNAEVELVKILEAKKLIDEIISYVEDKLNTEMGKISLKKIVGHNIIVTKRLTGQIYGIEDKTKAKNYLKEVKYDMADSEKIKAQYNKTGKLPTGVFFKDRTESVSIEERGE
jgi:predicted transcriptional regulator